MLFDEDFDLPPPSERALEPEVIEPLFTLSQLRSARDDAARESREATLAEINGFASTAASRALVTIAEEIVTARAEATSFLEQSAEAIVSLLLTCFATAFPALCARHGAGETTALLREILSSLHHEPKITIHVNPHIAAAMVQAIEALDADLAIHVRLVPTDTVTLGDARIAWENGSATRDALALWNQIESILVPAGLLNTERKVKEYAFGE